MAQGKRYYTNSEGVWRLVAAEGRDVTSVAKRKKGPVKKTLRVYPWQKLELPTGFKRD